MSGACLEGVWEMYEQGLLFIHILLMLILLLLYEHSMVYNKQALFLIHILLVYEHGVVYKQCLLLTPIQLL